MNKAYAIFDMDGTLVDSMPYWEHLTDEYLATQGVHEIPDSLRERIKPLTVREGVELFIREFGLVGTVESVIDGMTALMETHYRLDVPQKAGVEDYLRRLQARGVEMCVASATAEPLMRICLERLGLLPYFRFILSCESVGAGKHRPDVYLEATRRLGSAPADTAVYEDAIYAARTAAEAGFYVVGIYDEHAKDHWEELCTLSDEQVTSWDRAEIG